MRILRSVGFIVLAVTSDAATACLPASPDWQPPTVESLYRRSTYVVHAEVVAFANTVKGRRAKVKVLERFKGPSLEDIDAPGHSCAPRVAVGRAGIYFLDGSGSGSALDYPIGQSEAEILEQLRKLKAKIP